MTYWNILFLGLFLPLTLILYNVLPQKHRWKVLLGASYIFFWSISGKLIIFLLMATFILHYYSLFYQIIQNERDNLINSSDKEKKKQIKEVFAKKQKKLVTVAILFLIGILVVLKYSEFLGVNLNSLFNILNIPINFEIPKFVVPIGISFYTLEAVSYVMDVYKGKIKPDNHIGRLGLYLAFFPQIMEGPICRYSETANSLYEGRKSTYKSITFGAQRMIWGLAKKMIIADRLNPLVETIFDNYGQYDGGIMFVGMALYTLQLYMDFSGTMDIAIGIAQMFNVKLTENFKQPFFSKTISEFWQRWHITLGTWFKDYIFYPVSLTENCKKITVNLRKKIGKFYGPLVASAIALFCVWICNGLWHGAGWNFIFFGMYHFILILLGRVIEPPVRFVNDKLHINSNNIIYRILQIIRTTILVFIGEMFFRANGIVAGLAMFKTLITNFTFTSIGNGTILELGLDIQDFIIVFVMVILLFVVGILREKKVDIREKIASKNIVIRWSIYFALLFMIFIFGAYGVEYTPVDPMYAQF